MVTKGIIAIIPARGGSKRIPRKNIVDFCGKPMIAWTIEAALDSGLFDTVLVSTDDEEIASVARQFGADVPFLRTVHHEDTAQVSKATLTALDQLVAYTCREFGIVVQLMPNCPLRWAGDIRSAYDHFDESGASMQISCFQLGWINPWWALRLDESGHGTPLFPEARQKRSQELETLYCLSGAIWIARTAALRAAGDFYGPGHIYCPLDWKAAVDIDDQDDLEFAKALFSMNIGTSNSPEPIRG